MKWAVGILSVGLLAAVGWALTRGDPVDTRFERVGPGRIRRVLTVVGPVLPETHAVVLPKLPSRVTQILVSIGDHVEKGQTLIVLDTTEVAVEVRRRELALRRASVRRDQLLRQRAEAAGDAAASSQEEIELAQADVELAALELSRSRSMASEAVLRSPIQGEVIQLGAQLGEMLYPNRPASEGVIISAADTYVIRAEIDEFELAQVSAGLTATIHFDAAPGIELHGRVRQPPSLRRYRVDSRQGASFELTVTIDGDLPSRIRSGLTGVADINLGSSSQAEVLVVHQSSLIRFDNRDFVIVRSPTGDLRLSEVELGNDDDEWVEVKSGVVSGDLVAVGDITDLASRIRGPS
jgi:cobalt-zinc-cadmium efflux system membrane fusion protein